MVTVAQSPTIRKAFHATLAAQPGVAFATADRYFFASDAGELIPLTNAHVSRFVLLGDVIQAEDAYLDDLLRGGAARIVCTPTLAGRQVQITLRDTDETRLLARLAAVLARFPVPHGEAAPAPPRESGLQDGGTAHPTPEGWCLRHGTQMKRNTNERGQWWSHPLGDGKFCQGK